VLDLMVGLTREEGTTVVLVTHDARVAVLDHERGLGRSQAASAGDHLREAAA
jgi:predicted ABC-type transport system involved in lysophospholipase L1 biosynthesis ATPase subunit